MYLPIIINAYSVVYHKIIISNQLVHKPMRTDWTDEPDATGRLAPAQEIILSCFVSHLPDKPRYYSRLHKI